ncbi:hypothetical protein GGR58DRAFT_507349 [Xylaria digitata]|nr:hypothetical protein GGR58DRAFT_507349 [Xylaria digitata]
MAPPPPLLLLYSPERQRITRPKEKLIAVFAQLVTIDTGPATLKPPICASHGYLCLGLFVYAFFEPITQPNTGGGTWNVTAVCHHKAVKRCISGQHVDWLALPMPSTQQLLPTETRKGSGSSAFPFSITSLSDFVVRVASGFRLGTSGDMNKPGNLGAPRPMNTLSNNSASSRTIFGVPSSSRSIPSTPPAKRQKLDENNTNLGYSRATFAVDESTTPRKRSIESLSVTDSQRSVASNTSTPQPKVAEYRHIDNYTKNIRYRKKESNPRFLAQLEEVESSPPRPIPPQKSDEDVSEDEVDLINPQKALQGSAQLKRKQPQAHPISEYSNRFKGASNLVVNHSASHIFSKAIDTADKNMKDRQPNLSPDELAPSSEEIAASRPTKRLRQFSPSLSKRGNILPTNFGGFSAAKSYTTTNAECQQIDEKKKQADMIIGDGLRIMRGASGRSQYQADYGDDPDYCFLSVRQIGHTLYPVDQEQNFLKPYKYLTLDIKKAKSIIRSAGDDENRMVVVNSGINISNGAGPKLVIEFESPTGFSKFFEWVALYRDRKDPISIKDCNRAKLEKDFDEMVRRAETHKLRWDDETQALVADDIRVIQHNQSNRVPGPVINPRSTTENKNRLRLRDAMKSSSTTRSNGNGYGSTLNQTWGDRLASAQRQTRTTRSTFALIDSPEPEPIPEGWTTLNAGWDKQWRNSLVYPNTGKNRATVDKDDIQRLDEGQFLNDNIIIFYLRYLQKTLEDTNEDLAKRIFFQNTFFYDKLKPTKTGQGINFDSVKTWTSKVDLFSKDYIIVPINEYSHWYVAIICNAPKLLPSSNSSGQDDHTKSDIIAITDENELSQETPQASSHDGISNGRIDGEHVASPAQEVPVQVDVVENLRRMSIDSSDHPSGGTEQKANNDVGERANTITTERDREVYVIKDSDKPAAEVEHTATPASPQSRKKAGKRQIVGLRKYDPSQPRIITLDSLGATHSPTCSYLKQYLVAELQDKKGLEIPPPGAMGTTAKDVPEQTNHCDCGLFLLGYIQEFLRNPDNFVKSLLQRDGGISWRLNPSELRNNIRDLIFDLQKKQQGLEDLAQERKQQAKINKQQAKVEETLNHTSTPATIHSYTPSKPTPVSQDCGGDKAGKSQSPPALPIPLPSSSRDSSTGVGEATDLGHLPSVERNTKHAIIDVHPSVPNTQNNGPRTTRQKETDGRWDVEEMQAKSKASPHAVTSPHKTKQAINHKTHHQVPGAFPISPIGSRTAKYHSPSSETDVGTNLQNTLLGPLASESPSSKGSRGATPLDPVVLDDSDNNSRGRTWQSPQKRGGSHSGHLLVVEIPSANIHGQSPGQDGKKDDRKQTEQQSPYFSNRRDGERITAAKLRDKPQNDVIDLSDD